MRRDEEYAALDAQIARLTRERGEATQKLESASSARDEAMRGRDGLIKVLEATSKERDVYRSEAFDLQAKMRDTNLQNSVLREMVQRGLCEIGGWRELVAMLDDLRKPAPVGSAMWAALDQMDRWRKDARKAVEGDTVNRVGSSPTERPCCVDAYARGHAVGRQTGETFPRSLPSTDGTLAKDVIETRKCAGCGWTAGHDRRCAVAGDDIEKRFQSASAKAHQEFGKTFEILAKGTEAANPSGAIEKLVGTCGKDVFTESSDNGRTECENPLPCKDHSAYKRVEDCPNECRRCQAGIPDTFDARKNAWCLDCETYICPACWAGHNAQYHGQT